MNFLQILEMKCAVTQAGDRKLLIEFQEPNGVLTAFSMKVTDSSSLPCLQIPL